MKLVVFLAVLLFPLTPSTAAFIPECVHPSAQIGEEGPEAFNLEYLQTMIRAELEGEEVASGVTHTPGARLVHRPCDAQSGRLIALAPGG
jgi:hypothetical protein